MQGSERPWSERRGTLVGMYPETSAGVWCDKCNEMLPRSCNPIYGIQNVSNIFVISIPTTVKSILELVRTVPYVGLIYVFRATHKAKNGCMQASDVSRLAHRRRRLPATDRPFVGQPCFITFIHHATYIDTLFDPSHRYRYRYRDTAARPTTLRLPNTCVRHIRYLGGYRYTAATHRQQRNANGVWHIRYLGGYR